MSNQSVHVLSVLNLNERHLSQIRAVSPRLVVNQRPVREQRALAFQKVTVEEFARVLSPEVEILCTMFAPFDLALTPNLRWVQTYNAGIDMLRNTPLWNSEIAITNASGVHSIQISERVMSMLLALAYRLPIIHRLQAEQHWPDGDERLRLAPTELYGLTLGILGYGAIGRQIARLAASFGMRILATKRAGRSTSFDGWTPPGTGDPSGNLPARFYDLEELHSMLPECDVLVLALPLTPQTRHIIGQAEFALLPRHSYIVNIGRGPLIDHEALITALQNHNIGGAALDVTEPEPLPASSPLWNMTNVLITPHIAGLSRYYDDRIVDLFCINLQRYLAGEPLYNLVQRELGY